MRCYIRKYALLLLLLSITYSAMAQRDNVVQRVLAELTAEDEVDIEEYTAFLYALLDCPWDINHVNAEQLSQLIFLSGYQIDNIIRFRGRAGSFIAVSELLLVDGITQAVYNNLRNFVYADAKTKLRKSETIAPLKGEVFTRTVIQWPRKEGFLRYPYDEIIKESERKRYEETRFEGVPYAFGVKARLQQGTKWDAGMALEQDAGEGFAGGGRPLGVDYVNGYVHFRTDWLSVLVGSYSLAWGHGLMLCNRFALGNAFTNGISMGNGVTPHRSWREGDYFRGITLQYRPLPGVCVEMFGSYNKWDGKYYAIAAADGDSVLFATLRTDGLHRNLREQSGRRQVEELCGGGRLEWNGMLFKVGVMGMAYHYTPGLYRFPTRVYSQWEDNGRKRLLGGTYFAFSPGRIAVSGEGVFSASGSRLDVLKNDIAFMLNVVYRGDRWNALLGGRYLGKSYNSRFANATTAFSGVGNEQGLMGQWESNVGRFSMLRVRGDVFSPLRPRYRISEPRWGHDVRAEWTYSKKRHTLSARIRTWGKPEDEEKELTVLKYRQEVRMRYGCDSLGDFSLLIQTGLSYYAKHAVEEWGVAASLRVAYDRDVFRVSAAVAYGDTDGYNSRIYLSAPIIRYGYSSVLLYQRTFHNVLNFTYKASNRIELQTRAECIVYPGKSSLGSAADEIYGNKKCTLTAQFIYKW
ncbi:MAG: ComEA family DNA-binding protein [Marinifilaceae bacterium]